MHGSKKQGHIRNADAGRCIIGCGRPWKTTIAIRGQASKICGIPRGDDIFAVPAAPAAVGRGRGRAGDPPAGGSPRPTPTAGFPLPITRF